MSRLRKVLIALGGVVALVALLLVRSGDDGRKRAPLTPTTTRPDLTGVSLPGASGTTTTTVVTNAGEVRFTGTVRTPEGATVPGATVRAEWHRSNPPQVIEVLTDDQGRWELRDVAGGRWKIRAWRSPDFATGKVEQLFLSSKAERTLDLEVRAVEDFSVTWDIEPDPPITDHNAELVVLFVERTVDVEGRAITTPVVDMPVELVAGTVWQRLRGDAEETTDASGRVSWVLRCRADGPQSLSVSTRFGVKRLDLPACIPITSTSTTTTIPEETTTTRKA